MCQFSWNLETSNSSFPKRTACPMKMGPICCPETSVNNYHPTQISFTSRRKPRITQPYYSLNVLHRMWFTLTTTRQGESKPRTTRNTVLQKHQPIVQGPRVHFDLQLESCLGTLLLMHIVLRLLVVLKHEVVPIFNQMHPTPRRNEMTSILGGKLMRGCKIWLTGCMWMSVAAMFRHH